MIASSHASSLKNLSFKPTPLLKKNDIFLGAFKFLVSISASSDIFLTKSSFILSYHDTFYRSQNGYNALHTKFWYDKFDKHLNLNPYLGYREELYSRLEIRRILKDHEKPKRPRLKQKNSCERQVINFANFACNAFQVNTTLYINLAMEFKCSSNTYRTVLDKAVRIA